MIWTIKLKTSCQNNTYCVDNKDKIIPYIDECMKESRKCNRYTNHLYRVEWLMVDYGVIYEIDDKGDRVWGDGELKSFGKIHRYFVN